MTEERRKAGRASIPGIRVIVDDAAGGRVETDVLNIGSGGLFIRSENPLAVGKRMTLEVRGVQGVAAWSALGRVVWTRDAGATAGPPGMGVKLIDVDDAVVAAIGVLVDAHPQRAAGAGTGKAPPRERTMLGIGMASAPVAGVAVKPPPKERSVQEPPPEDWDVPGAHDAATKETVVPQIIVPVGPARDEAPPAAAPAPEASIAVDLVAKKPPEIVADSAPETDDEPVRVQAQAVVRQAETPPSEASLAAAGVPRRRGGRWFLFLLLVIACSAGALYLLRGRIPWVQRLVAAWTASPPAPAPAVPPPVAPTATAVPTVTTAGSSSATGATSVPAVPTPVPSASAVPSKAPPRAAPPVRPPAAPAKPPASDNPY